MAYLWIQGKGRALAALILALLTGCVGSMEWGTAAIAASAPAAETAERPRLEPRDTAQERIEAYIRDNGIGSSQIEVGYYNTATGEEAYVNGDGYLEAASMFKVALCMYWTEKISDGELSWDDFVGGYRLDYAIEESLVYSNNFTAFNIQGAIGDYGDYRAAMIPFYGDVPEEELEYFCSTSYLTPRQIIHVLKMLYKDPDRYPRVVEFLLRANPGEYFRSRELPWKVAQKYGYFFNGELMINACAIVFSDPPFLLVVMTQSLGDPELHMNALCRMLGEYTELSARDENGILSREKKDCEVPEKHPSPGLHSLFCTSAPVENRVTLPGKSGNRRRPPGPAAPGGWPVCPG